MLKKITIRKGLIEKIYPNKAPLPNKGDDLNYEGMYSIHLTKRVK